MSLVILLNVAVFLFYHVSGFCYDNQIDEGVIAYKKLHDDPLIYWSSHSIGDTVCIEMKGPADNWFGIGIDGSIMFGTYALIAFPDDPTITEWRLGANEPGDPLPITIDIESDTVDDETRIIHISRSREGYSNLYYTFPAVDTRDVGIIYAWGQSDEFIYHGLTHRNDEKIAYLFANDTSPEPTPVPSPEPSPSPTDAPTGSPTPAPSNAPSSSPTPGPTVTFSTRYDLEGQVILGGDYADNIELTIGIEAETKLVFITLTGPTSQWFAVGFGSKTMEDTYAIVVDWRRANIQEITDDHVHEYYLGDHTKGERLEKFIFKQIQETQKDFRRSVLLERLAFAKDDTFNDTDPSQYFNFSICTKEYPIIWARGDYNARAMNMSFNGHQEKDRGTGKIRIEAVEGDDENFKCNQTHSIFDYSSLYVVIFAIMIQLFL